MTCFHLEPGFRLAETTVQHLSRLSAMTHAARSEALLCLRNTAETKQILDLALFDRKTRVLS